MPAHHEIESPIFQNHIPLMGQVCEHQNFDLDPNFELILTPNLLLNLCQLPESVFVLAHFEPKSIIFHNHTQFSDNQRLFFKIRNLMGIIF